MPSIDFFDPTISKTNCDAIQFGICDGDPKATTDDLQRASIKTTQPGTWEATVRNSNQRPCVFTPIDHNVPIYKDETKAEKDSSCDGMLVYDGPQKQGIVFIELKNRRMNWIEEGIQQLAHTIKLFSANHNLSNYSPRRANLANKRHPHFHYQQTEPREYFRNHLKIRLNIEAQITLP